MVLPGWTIPGSEMDFGTFLFATSEAPATCYNKIETTTKSLVDTWFDVPPRRPASEDNYSSVEKHELCDGD